MRSENADNSITDSSPYSPFGLERRQGSIIAAKLMADAALTAAKSGRGPAIESAIVCGQEEQERIARKLEQMD